MDTIIRKKTGETFNGQVVKKPAKCCRYDGTLIDYWLFQVEINGGLHIWECHSDYWDLINTDLLKVSNALRINESQEPNILDKLKNILKWGFCK